MITENFIRDVIEQFIVGTDKFIVSIKVKPGNKIAVFMDADSSITISDCAQLSRFIESSLDRENNDFELEVSSAGIDQPFSNARQYKKNIGRKVKVILKDGSLIKGQLSIVNEDTFEVKKENLQKKNKVKESINDLVTVEFLQVKETRLEINI